VHGADDMQTAERAAAVLFGSSLLQATAEEILTVFDDVPSVEVTRAAMADGVAIVELVVTAGLAASKGEATRLIKQGGLYVNDQRVGEERGRVTLAHAIDGRVVVLRKGQRERRIVRVV
jgi:tyrosyl-tRNA synthetase